MGDMHGMRCAATLLKWFLIFLDVVGSVIIALIMLRIKNVARWGVFRWASERMCRLCGIPFGKDLSDIGNAMFERYKCDRKADALAYADRVVDRQINKARGILPFNSILIAALSLENRSGIDPATTHMLEYLAYPVVAGLFISSLLLLELFWVHWGKLTEYKSFKQEVANGVVMARDRSIILDTSISLSVTCIFGLLLGVIGLPFVRWIYWIAGIHGSLGVCWR